MFAAWNTEYMKVDNCYIDGGSQAQNAPKDPRRDFPQRFGAMSSALQARDIKGMLVCQWGSPYDNETAGLQGPAQWTPPLSTSYRVSDDIATGWANVQRIMSEAIHVNLRGLSGPGRFSDMDLLEVGNEGMTFAEQRSHFAIWAMFKSALMISTNVPNMSRQTMGIFANKDLIAINQDMLGAPVKLVQRFSQDRDVLAGPLANGDQVVLLLDQSNKARQLSINFADISIASADVKNLWTGVLTKGARSYAGAVGAHGSAPLRLSNVKRTSPATPQIRYYSAEAGILAGGANIQPCTACARQRKVGNIGSGASLTISGIRTSKGTQDVRFDYLDCEIGYLAEQGPNVRGASISVNGGPAQKVLFPLTGYNWDVDVSKGFLVWLSGFKTKAANSIRISPLSSVSSFAPDIDRIGVPV